MFISSRHNESKPGSIWTLKTTQHLSGLQFGNEYTKSAVSLYAKLTVSGLLIQI